MLMLRLLSMDEPQNAIHYVFSSDHRDCCTRWVRDAAVYSFSGHHCRDSSLRVNVVRMFFSAFGHFLSLVADTVRESPRLSQESTAGTSS